MLDAWIRDVCYYYKNFPSLARQEIRDFFKFDMSQPNDIFFQDQLAWGTVQHNQKTHAPVLIIQQSVLDTMSPEMQDEIETMTAVDMKEHNNTGGSVFGSGGGGGSARKSPNNTRRTSSVMNGGGNGAKHNRPLQSIDERSERSNNHLQSLIWETASVGGVSKIPKQQANKLVRRPTVSQMNQHSIDS